MAYTYSESSQRFRDDVTGRFVPAREVNAAVDRVIAAASNNVRTITAQLQSGAITLPQWQTQMAAEIKPLHVGAAAMGRGGFPQMSQSDYGWTGQRLRTQYGYLREFANDIASGKQPVDGRLVNRAVMYAEAARSTQREMQRRLGIMMLRQEERNVLGASDRHCAACVGCTARGWVPIGSLPPVGSRTCLSRCKCTIQTRGNAMQVAA